MEVSAGVVEVRLGRRIVGSLKVWVKAAIGLECGLLVAYDYEHWDALGSGMFVSGIACLHGKGA